jgi:hypothetical protein
MYSEDVSPTHAVVLAHVDPPPRLHFGLQHLANPMAHVLVIGERRDLDRRLAVVVWQVIGDQRDCPIRGLEHASRAHHPTVALIANGGVNRQEPSSLIAVALGCLGSVQQLNALLVTRRQQVTQERLGCLHPLAWPARQQEHRCEHTKP